MTGGAAVAERRANAPRKPPIASVTMRVVIGAPAALVIASIVAEGGVTIESVSDGDSVTFEAAKYFSDDCTAIAAHSSEQMRNPGWG